MNVLELKGLTKQFGGITAVNDVTFHVEEKQIFALIGPNGAGKTTAFNLISGVYVPTSGTVTFCGKVLNKMKPNRIVKEGIARTFQNIRLFGKMTALENVMTGFTCRTKADIFSIIFQMGKCKKEHDATEAKALEILDYIGLADLRDELAGSLPYGHQRLLEIARALACEPKLLMLDEPAAGMNKAEKQDLIELITKIRNDRGISVMLVEHDMDVIMSIADRIAVLNYGSLLAFGDKEEIQKDTAVIEAYLGNGD
ncbi:MAG: ABC transporter ATP-binding protein [Lachnospiraceae bacterium]|jgi:branched-chain amino acid transport system ATP-binding protein|nr:ABC transporter ATP-binding protein [Lachnospiraceae bacterium]